MACGDVVVCIRGVVCDRGIGGMQRFCYWQRRWWRAAMLLLFGAAEAEVGCGGFVLVCSRGRGGMRRFCCIVDRAFLMHWCWVHCGPHPWRKGEADVALVLGALWASHLEEG